MLLPAPPICVCPAFCVTAFELPPVALALDEFVCVTGPSSPGLSIRTTTLTLVGATWVDVAFGAADCVVGALWVTVCDWPEVGAEAGLEGVLDVDGALAAPPVWVCALCCVVELVFVALLEAALLLCCWVAPPLAPAFVAACCPVDEAVAV